MESSFDQTSYQPEVKVIDLKGKLVLFNSLIDNLIFPQKMGLFFSKGYFSQEGFYTLP